MKSFGAIRKEEGQRVVRLLCSNSGSVVNLSRVIFSWTFNVVSRAAFGRNCGYKDEFLDCLLEFVELAGGFSVADVFDWRFVQIISGLKRKFERIHKTMDRILESVIAEHRSKEVGSESEDGLKDFVDVLLDLQKNGDLKYPLTDNVIKAILLVSSFVLVSNVK